MPSRIQRSSRRSAGGCPRSTAAGFNGGLAILGVSVRVDGVDVNDADEIVAICRRGRQRQLIPILDLPLPSPPPAGWEWIEAYRHWARGGRQSGFMRRGQKWSHRCLPMQRCPANAYFQRQNNWKPF